MENARICGALGARARFLCRARRLAALGRSFARWQQHRFRAARRHRSQIKAALHTSLLRLWGAAAAEAARALSFFPREGLPAAAAEAEDAAAVEALCALGGEWAGGGEAVATSVRRVTEAKRLVREARAAEAEAAEAREASASRAAGLLGALPMAQAELDALEAAVAREEAEVLVLHSAMLAAKHAPGGGERERAPNGASPADGASSNGASPPCLRALPASAPPPAVPAALQIAREITASETAMRGAMLAVETECARLSGRVQRAKLEVAAASERASSSRKSWCRVTSRRADPAREASDY